MSDRLHGARSLDRAIAALLAAGVFALYTFTLLPGIGSADTAEFQRVLPTLGVAHPTGYPLYTILGFMWSLLPLGGSPAWRISMFSAAAAAAAIGVVYTAARAIGQTRPVAAASALTLAVSYTFWSQATIAEVYALAALIQALVLLALLRWQSGRWPLWVVGLLVGLGLAHHRTIVLMIPGALLFVGLEAWGLRLGDAGEKHASSLTSQAAKATLAAAAGCLLYAYLPLRAPPWLDSWQTFARHVAGSDALGVWLTIDAPWRVASEHLRQLAARFIWPQFFPLGAVLALAGALRVWLRRPAPDEHFALAALLTSGYVLTLLFCVLFFVDDVAVFMISAHMVAALLVGEGAMLLGSFGRRRTTKDQTIGSVDSAPRSLVLGPWSFWPLAGLALLALPAMLLARNLPAIRAANTRLPELSARATLAQPLPPNSLLLIDWDAVEPLRYLQQIEGLRPDVEVLPLNEDVARQDVDAALAAGRPAYVLHALPGLGLAQVPEGRLWRVGAQPLALHAATPAGQRWNDGIALAGFTLPPGPFHPGDIVPVILDWRATMPPQGTYTLFVHVVGPDGALWGQQDRPPAPAPTLQWKPGAPILDLYGPSLRIDTPPGRYTVAIGWYEYPSLVRLPIASGAGDSITLGDIEVVALPGASKP